MIGNYKVKQKIEALKTIKIVQHYQTVHLRLIRQTCPCKMDVTCEGEVFCLFKSAILDGPQVTR